LAAGVHDASAVLLVGWTGIAADALTVLASLALPKVAANTPAGLQVGIEPTLADLVAELVTILVPSILARDSKHPVAKQPCGDLGGPRPWGCGATERLHRIASNCDAVPLAVVLTKRARIDGGIPCHSR
jgi:hypothetical protein